MNSIESHPSDDTQLCLQDHSKAAKVNKKVKKVKEAAPRPGKLDTQGKNNNIMTTKTTRNAIKTSSACLLVLALWVSSAACLRQQLDERQFHTHRISAFAARRAADDSRPFKRIASRQVSLGGLRTAESQPTASVVMGKFKAPAPERVQRSRIPQGSQFGIQTMGASYRVADNDSELPEKVVHGIVGASASANQPQRTVQRTVGAKIQVSDEGLNYPPSKLSADIYGNVAEIVTAPPEAVDSDFLLPNSNRFGNFNGKRR